ncbi:hypothetical protein KW438_10245 [Vibrio fluvialis]|nr:hypothetical protein [Vibrio fluvialis]MBY8103930.1 hypothetical protein [Vibrio fluvialis]
MNAAYTTKDIYNRDVEQHQQRPFIAAGIAWQPAYSQLQVPSEAFEICDWLEAEQAKPAIVRDLEREKAVKRHLIVMLEPLVKAKQKAAKKTAQVLEDRKQRKAQFQAAADVEFRKFHETMTALAAEYKCEFAEAGVLYHQFLGGQMDCSNAEANRQARIAASKK